jgi:hypothetical protein
LFKAFSTICFYREITKSESKRKMQAREARVIKEITFDRHR